MDSHHHLPFDHQGTFLHMCSQGGSSDFENEKYVVSYLLSEQGPDSSPDFPAILILKY